MELLLDLAPRGLAVFESSSRLVRARPCEESHEEISCRIGRLGWGGCSARREVKGLLWERVTADQQAAEIRRPGPRRAINRQNPARSILTPPARGACFALKNE